MNYAQLLEEVERFVTLYFKTHHDDRFVYHNYNHTRDVAAAALRLINHYPLSAEDRFIVLTAAWFHDTGYGGTDTTDHEEKGALIATDFLRGLQVSDAVIIKIKDCILATKMPQSPHTLLEQILCDADLFHLGNEDFKPKSRLMHREVEALKDIKISKKEWRQKTIYLMEQHNYHTDFARELLSGQKQKNIEELKAKQKKSGGAITADLPPHFPDLSAGKQKDTVKDNKQQPKKGIETMFRITAGNHQRLSDMADRKAHIMISVNSIVISLLLSLLLRRLDEHPKQAIPAMLLLSVSLVTTIFSVLATRPSLSKGTFTDEDINHQDVNLLFFGSFYKMTFDQYKHGMLTMMNDHDFLYGSLIRDLYSQGVVLGRKYKLLRISYNVFMFGLSASVVAFIISSII